LQIELVILQMVYVLTPSLLVVKNGIGMTNIPYQHVFQQLSLKLSHIHRSLFEKLPKCENSHYCCLLQSV